MLATPPARPSLMAVKGLLSERNRVTPAMYRGDLAALGYPDNSGPAWSSVITQVPDNPAVIPGDLAD